MVIECWNAVMSDFSSVFVVLPSDIIEICFSRDSLDDSKDSEKRMDVSQFLLLVASQFLLYISQFKINWKKWLFLVLQIAIGEGFRIDSFRDYPREEFTGKAIDNLLVNEYDLKANIRSHQCSLRIDPTVKKNFFDIIKREDAGFFKRQIKEYLQPFHSEFNEGKIRTLDLKLLLKRKSFSAPSLFQVQTWIISWQPITLEEYNQLNKIKADIENIDIAQLAPFLSDTEITSKGWNEYRDPSLEQPWGLICPTCKMAFNQNIYAKTCYSCQTELKRA